MDVNCSGTVQSSNMGREDVKCPQVISYILLHTMYCSSPSTLLYTIISYWIVMGFQSQPSLPTQPKKILPFCDNANRLDRVNK